MRLFCIQNGLRDRHSHYLQESEGIAEACRASGVALRLYAHRRVQPALAAATGAVPAFHHAPSTVLETDPVIGILSDYITLAAAFAADCAALAADGVGAGDIVLLPYAEAWAVHGLAQFLATLPAGTRPRVACHFVMAERNWRLEAGRSRIAGEASFIRHAATRLREAAPAGGVLFATVDPRLGAMVRALSGTPCRQVPMPMRYPPPAELNRLRAAGRHPPVDVCIAGQFRREKGSDLVAPVLAGLAATRPGARVAVQVNDPDGAAALAEALGPAAEAMEIFLHVGECGHEDWYARLLAARLMLLPYEPESYAARTSGIFAEAAACGVPVVAPAETWMADQIEAGHAAGATFAAFTPASVLQALAAAEARHPALAAAAGIHRAHWQRGQTAAAWLAAMLAPAD
ncbi:MAG: hypothetical protein J0H91_11040 [Rhodospirillales bacterium]|nr:hypothetical protein [Rhodospirillales bacterium]